jgi:hypothetical protein
MVEHFDSYKKVVPFICYNDDYGHCPEYSDMPFCAKDAALVKRVI